MTNAVSMTQAKAYQFLLIFLKLEKRTLLTIKKPRVTTRLKIKKMYDGSSKNDWLLSRSVTKKQPASVVGMPIKAVDCSLLVMLNFAKRAIPANKKKAHAA